MQRSHKVSLAGTVFVFRWKENGNSLVWWALLIGTVSVTAPVTKTTAVLVVRVKTG